MQRDKKTALLADNKERFRLFFWFPQETEPFSAEGRFYRQMLADFLCQNELALCHNGVIATKQTIMHDGDKWILSCEGVVDVK